MKHLSHLVNRWSVAGKDSFFVLKSLLPVGYGFVPFKSTWKSQFAQPNCKSSLRFFCCKLGDDFDRKLNDIGVTYLRVVVRYFLFEVALTVRPNSASNSLVGRGNVEELTSYQRNTDYQRYSTRFSLWCDPILLIISDRCHTILRLIGFSEMNKIHNSICSASRTILSLRLMISTKMSYSLFRLSSRISELSVGCWRFLFTKLDSIVTLRHESCFNWLKKYVLIWVWSTHLKSRTMNDVVILSELF